MLLLMPRMGSRSKRCFLYVMIWPSPFTLREEPEFIAKCLNEGCGAGVIGRRPAIHISVGKKLDLALSRA